MSSFQRDYLDQVLGDLLHLRTFWTERSKLLRHPEVLRESESPQKPTVRPLVFATYSLILPTVFLAASESALPLVPGIGPSKQQREIQRLESSADSLESAARIQIAEADSIIAAAPWPTPLDSAQLRALDEIFERELATLEGLFPDTAAPAGRTATARVEVDSLLEQLREAPDPATLAAFLTARDRLFRAQDQEIAALDSVSKLLSRQSVIARYQIAIQQSSVGLLRQAGAGYSVDLATYMRRLRAHRIANLKISESMAGLQAVLSITVVLLASVIFGLLMGWLNRPTGWTRFVNLYLYFVSARFFWPTIVLSMWVIALDLTNRLGQPDLESLILYGRFPLLAWLVYAAIDSGRLITGATGETETDGQPAVAELKIGGMVVLVQICATVVLALVIGIAIGPIREALVQQALSR